ncbi:diguanylate cyclase [Leucothrix sargassi]|nr:diguanylate cyclase [Leucothrix sargassi]
MTKLNFAPFENSINRLVITSFTFVLLLPIGFFIYSLFQNSWQQVEQRMLEKHQLISTSLVEPFFLFIDGKQKSVKAIGNEINHAIKFDSNTSIQRLLDQHLEIFEDFTALSYTSANDDRYHSTLPAQKTLHWVDVYQQANFRAIQDEQGNPSESDLLSSAFHSLVTNEPVVLLRHKIFNQQNQYVGTLDAEVSVSNIAAMCSKINFGVKGHCATVDHLGHVIAHPNKNWVKNIQDVSSVSVVKQMLAGESGTTEFYSPFLRAEMVVGFNSIPQLGWGVMIPQPKSELTSIFDEIRSSIMLWLLFGVLSAALIAWKLADEITRPIKSLMLMTNKVAKNKYLETLGDIPKNSPKEIQQLWLEFSKLVSGLQSAHNKAKKLNESLHKDIEKATSELRIKNRKLYELSNLDYLTSIPNRRYFTHYLDQKIKENTGDDIGVIFIDIDHFKKINDSLGHEVGDEALILLADILKKSIRTQDVVARLGGDEFVVYIENADQETIAAIAERIRKTAQDTPLTVDTRNINLSLSLGTVKQQAFAELTSKDFFRNADKAMYQSKEQGRNTITHYTAEAS